MTLSLYDSKTQSTRDFVPLQPGKAGIYLCGPTVQGAPHVGHLRSALVYDQLRRWLTAKGHEVTLVRNVTDIDDKVLENAKVTGEQWWALAYRFEIEFNAAYSQLRIAAPTYEPRATASIPEMLAIIERLIANGYAYQAEDGSADVYFAASKCASYGELTNQKLEDLADAGEGELRGKRDPRDFTLWKAHKPGEPESAAWDTRFGKGRPGWHIECSAMSTKYLGSAFDIHGGGLDLRFPHHENELAQSRAAGDDFANFWLHNGLVNVGGQKMSKSLGNSIFAADFLGLGRAIAIRYYLGSAHYRSVLDYHEGVIEEAEAALTRIESFIERAYARVQETSAEPIEVSGVPLERIFQYLPTAFVGAMDDDLAIPQALAALHEQVRLGNTALDQDDHATVGKALLAVRSMLAILGIDPLDPTWAEQDGSSAEHHALDQLVRSLIEQRNQARNDRDFARADQIRNQLASAGIALSDGASATNWSVNG